MSSLNKIHVNSATGLSLNERFTAIAERRIRTRSQNRNNTLRLPAVNPNVAAANRRLLLQLERRHKMLAAMKLKRRSLRAPIGTILKRGSIKALRVAPNGKPIKANTLTKVATMNADLVSNTRRRSRSLRRAGSVPSIVHRLGIRSGRGIGGAAERIAKRRIARLRTQLKRFGSSYSAPNSRPSRSRSRAPMDSTTGTLLSHTQSRGRSRSRGRSQSRSRRSDLNVRRGRSMSKNRSLLRTDQDPLPVQSRLGFRSDRSTRRNIARGGIQKRPSVARNGQNRMPTGGRISQTRGRSRSRSRGRKGQQQQLQGTGARMGQRSHSRQRGVGKKIINGMNNGQQTRGRSRRRNGRNLGKNAQQPPNKDDLDKELDQYMATSKTEYDMGYLLRN